MSLGLLRQAVAVVGDADHPPPVAQADQHGRGPGARVAANVREPLLDDPEHLDLLVGAELDARLDLQVDVELSVGGEELDVAAERRVERRGPPAEERASTAKRASCCAAVAASWSRGSTLSSSAPLPSMEVAVEIAKRYCASPSWISRATRARSSATARPNSAARIARQTPTSSTP